MKAKKPGKRLPLIDKKREKTSKGEERLVIKNQRKVSKGGK